MNMNTFNTKHCIFSTDIGIAALTIVVSSNVAGNRIIPLRQYSGLFSLNIGISISTAEIDSTVRASFVGYKYLYKMDGPLDRTFVFLTM